MIEIRPVRKPLDTTIEVPGSKSYTKSRLVSCRNGEWCFDADRCPLQR